MTTQLYTNQCIQCGRCCQEEVCILGDLILRTYQTPCPALELAYGKYWCGLIRSPEKHMSWLSNDNMPDIAPLLKILFSFGVGCDAKGERWL